MSDLLRRVAASRYRLSTQLYLGIGSGVILTIAASLVGWFSFNRVGDVQSRVNEGTVPEVVAAFGVARSSGELVAAAPRLTAATVQDFEGVVESIDEAYRTFEQELGDLGEGSDVEENRFERIDSLADELLMNIDHIKSNRQQLFDVTTRRIAVQTELTNLRSRLDDVVKPALDDQYFYTMTGYRDFNEPRSQRDLDFSDQELEKYRNLAELNADSTIATQYLASSFNLSDASFIEPLREAFESAQGGIERSLFNLQGTQLYDDLRPPITYLLELGTGELNGFDLVSTELSLISRQEELLTQNREIAVELVSEVDVLVTTSQTSVDQATLASGQAILQGRTLLLAISAISVGGAGLIAWLFIGRFLLRRLGRLSVWMRRMAAGDLEATAEITGKDEVAEMAAALEVFRRHALEVQRLNLVEKLASELQEKNDQLEVVLEDLRKVQDQMIMQEKLAALGELTAGVAHEIRNPLNFVKNFSEVSEELIEEMKEVIDEAEGELSEDDQSLVQEITQDLVDNLERIRTHGERANRIVQDMLMMGRETGHWQLTNINNLVDEHARLAYHSARAADPDFQLDLKQELDPEAGEIMAIPRDLGRVFLNLVGNACDATDEKRRELQGQPRDGETYFPTLLLTSERREETIIIRVRDNGNGIPPDVADKMFNPFFTTKPTDRGTGLGLAISSDIVREHGGSITVNTEPGEFTEMAVELPIEQVQADTQAQTEETGDDDDFDDDFDDDEAL